MWFRHNTCCPIRSTTPTVFIFFFLFLMITYMFLCKPTKNFRALRALCNFTVQTQKNTTSAQLGSWSMKWYCAKYVLQWHGMEGSLLHIPFSTSPRHRAVGTWGRWHGPPPVRDVARGGAVGATAPFQRRDPYFKAGYMQIKTLGKCCFRPSGGFAKPKIFLYAPRQLMVALRLEICITIFHRFIFFSLIEK